METGWQRWRHLDGRTPVIVGVGRSDQRLDEPGAGLNALELMVAAAVAAGADSGAPRLLRRLDRVAVPEGSWRYRDAGRLVARAVGADDAQTTILGTGIPQQTLFNDAYADMLEGRIAVALVVGGEAAYRAAVARRAGIELVDAVGSDTRDPDELRRPTGEIISKPEVAAGIYAPAVQFALIDSALRLADGLSLQEHRDEIAALWAGFSVAASKFPGAAFPERRTAESIREPGPDNRPIAFPYNKWHCSQMNVDQAAAILVCTREVAEEAGVDPNGLVFPLVALESSYSVAVPRRRYLHRWPAMEILGRAAAEHLGHPLAAVRHVELYSCFPAAVRVQQRALDLPPDGVPTITGGEPFAGGPWNNFVLQATVAMIERLRRHPGERGLVTSVSGFLNKPALAIYSTELTDGLLVGDLHEAAAAATPTLGLLDEYRGRATIAACTVSFERSGDQRVIVIADTSDGQRCVAISVDPALAARAMTDELVGVAITVEGQTFVPDPEQEG